MGWHILLGLGTSMAELPIPSELFGDLFRAVQSRRIFPDSKSFADAVPRRAPGDIMAEWQLKAPLADADLQDFVAANFMVPVDSRPVDTVRTDFESYLSEALAALTRSQIEAPPSGSVLALPRPFIVPGGRFREFYYWDSYFAMLGMTGGGLQDRVEDMIENFGSLLDRYGIIPNASRTYYLSRSHPPFFYLAAMLSKDSSAEGRLRRLAWMRKEHDFWMTGADGLAPGEAHRRAVRLPDGAILNRYWDDLDRPRDESWLEDVSLAQDVAEGERAGLWRNLRAGAESGWDFSSRWLADGQSLASICATRIVPVDLNCLLFGLEKTIASESAALGLDAQASAFERRASARSAAISRYLWNGAAGFHADYWLDRGAVSDRLTAAAAFPLFVGQCSPAQARTAAGALQTLLAQGGLLTTSVETGQQWDAPNGWAPLQWIAFAGLRNYGESELADEIARRWVALVGRHYANSGQIMEKYDVVAEEAGGGGEYPVEIGFGWTNGVTIALLQALRTCPAAHKA